MTIIFWGVLTAGAFIPIYLLALLVERLICQRLFDDPVAGKIVSATIAWLILSCTVGYLMGGYSTFQLVWFLVFGAPAFIIGSFGIWRGMHLRDQSQFDPSIFE